MANQLYVHATELRIGDGADPEEFTAIAGIEGDIAFPQMERELMEITARDSPGNRREWGTGLEDSPELTVTIFWDPEDTGHQDLITHLDEGTEANYQFATPNDEVVWEVAMLVRNFAPTSPSGGFLRADVTFKPTGVIDRNAGDGDGDGS